MLSLDDPLKMDAALAMPLQHRLRQLLSDRIKNLGPAGLSSLTHIVVVEPGDTPDDLADVIGFSPLVNPLNHARFGCEGFQPFWDWLWDQHGWFEMVVTVGNSGFAFVLFIQDAEGVYPELRALCRRYAE